MSPGASIPLSRTAVPVEWDDFRKQLEKLTDALQPTSRDGVNSVGEFINSAADNVRGQGDTARDTVIKLSAAISALGDHADDIFSTVRNLQLLVSALYSSSDLLASFNQNLASVTTLLTNTPNEVANAIKGLDGALTDLRGFPRREPGSDGCHVRSAEFRHDRAERQPHGHQADPARRPDGVPELPEHLPAGAERNDRHHRAEQLRRHSAVDLQFDRGGVAGRAWTGCRSCACSTSIRSSRTACTTTSRRDSTHSSAPRPGPSEITYSEDWLRPGLYASGAAARRGRRRRRPPQPPPAERRHRRRRRRTARSTRRRYCGT